MNMFRCRFCGWTTGGDVATINRHAQDCPMCHADNVAEGYAVLIDEVDYEDANDYTDGLIAELAEDGAFAD